MKSPIKDLRFKNHSITTLKRLIPPRTSLNSYGLFAGQAELSLANAERSVTAFTNRPAIFEFWEYLIKDPERLYSVLTDRSFKFYGNSEFNILQEKLPFLEGQDFRAAVFFLLNRCSRTGQVSCGEFDVQHYNAIALNYLKTFKKPLSFNVESHTGDIEESITHLCDRDFILVPALRFNYNLFEHGKNTSYDTYSVNHRRLRDSLRTTQNKVILVYNFHPTLVSFYEDFNVHLIDEFANLTRDSDKYEEVIVTNF